MSLFFAPFAALLCDLYGKGFNHKARKGSSHGCFDSNHGSYSLADLGR